MSEAHRSDGGWGKRKGLGIESPNSKVPELGLEI